jgi:predicted membrane channel-forming protein YqfA (hemolysin III family)
MPSAGGVHVIIWHGFVLTAAACHYFAILDILAA